MSLSLPQRYEGGTRLWTRLLRPRPGSAADDDLGILRLYATTFRLRDLSIVVMAIASALFPGTDGRQYVVAAALLAIALPYNTMLRRTVEREGRVPGCLAWGDQVLAAGFVVLWAGLLAPAMIMGMLATGASAVMLDRRTALRGAAVGGLLFPGVVGLHHLWGSAGLPVTAVLSVPAYALAILTTAFTVGTVATRERAGQRQLTGLLESIEVVVYEVDAETLRVHYVSPYVTTLIGGAPQDYLGDPVRFLSPVHRRDVAMLLSLVADLSAGRRSHDIEYRVYTTEGELRWVRNQAAIEVRDDGRSLIRGTLTDITRQKIAELALAAQAHTDALTGLPNRAQLLETIAAASPRLGAQVLVFLDVDSFKRINDSLGHQAGDSLLVQIGSRLQVTLRAEDHVGRLGGDEFVVLSRLEQPEDAEVVVGRIQQAFDRPFQLDGRSVQVTASAGAVLIPAGAPDRAEALLEQADAAMYAAKRGGPGRHAFYTSSMREAALEHLDVESALRIGLAEQQFHLVYQPIVRATDHTLVGYEALLRWDHPERGLVAPADFIPVAEQTGQIVELGRWVLREACAQARQWLDLGEDLRLSVNLSAVQLTEPGLVGDVAAALRAADLPPSALCLEITETALIANPTAALKALQALRATGVAVALDDFGTGFSSLSHLHTYPVDTVKIDRSFVAGIGDGADSGIVAAILHLAGHMGLTVVAEGVESLGQADALDALGCDLLQGYALGRPARLTPRLVPDLHLEPVSPDADPVRRLG